MIKKLIQNDYLLFGLILIINGLFIFFLQLVLLPIQYPPHNFLVLELLGVAKYAADNLIFFEFGNILLIWLISKSFFKKYFNLIPPAILAISPWMAYLAIADSFYPFLLFWLLLLSFGVILIKRGQNWPGTILFVTGGVVVSYSLLLLLILIVILVIFSYINHYFANSHLRISVAILGFLLVPILVLLFINQPGVKNSFANEVMIFSDPGLVNMTNRFQGHDQDAHFGIIGRISENKYFFEFETVALKFSKQITPSTIFTSQEKLLGFSFSPPIFFGFLIPFALGLYQVLFNKKLRKFLFLPLLLIVPSILSKQIVDLNRLIIFEPVLIWLISYGLILLINNRSKKNAKLLLFLTLFLVLFQMAVMLVDIHQAEKKRFILYKSSDFVLDKQ